MNDDLKEYFKNMFASVNKNIVLDDDQINAILCDDKYTLVLAGAGTGKTTTMAGKVKYLVDIKHVDPSKILVISYTRKAVMELQELLIDKFGINTNVSTFHSLAYKYVRETFKNKKCVVIDYNKKEKVFYDYINDKFKDGSIKEIVDLFSKEVLQNKKSFYNEYFLSSYSDYNSYDKFFEFYKAQKFKEARRRGIYRCVEDWLELQYMNLDHVKTIRGENVKSVGEAVIANFLYRHGIDYRYESVYPEIVDERKIYRPDFTLNLAGENVYLEYFGLDSDEYNKIKDKKIAMHKQHNNKFFYIDGSGIGNIERKLHRKLIELGFIYNKRKPEEIYNQILDNNKLSPLYRLKKLFFDCVDQIKENIHRDDYLKIVKEYLEGLNPDEKDVCKRQFKYINDFYVYYSKKAYGGPSAYYFDFSDLIYYANKYIHEMKFLDLKQYEYIIIDEYQDISDGEYELARRTSNKCSAKIFAVGDDWQSIYAFRGSNIGYITRFKNYFKDPTILSIKNTYRNSQELVDVAGSFIKKNPDQIKKDLISYKHLSKPIHFIKYNDYVGNMIDDSAEYKVLKDLIKKIHEVYPTHNILILGRTNKAIDDCFKYNPDFKADLDTKIKIANMEDLELDGMTIHKSKGLTYDEVIIIGLNKSFPSEDHWSFWLLNLFKPEIPPESIEYAEERRVFYVALTRTKNNVFILTNENSRNRSVYVDELMRLCKNN